jgi:hypothetical protein
MGQRVAQPEQTYVDEGAFRHILAYVLRIAALISCALSVSAFEWSKENLLPVLVDFRGISFLALVPLSVVNCGCDFYLVATNELETEENFCLLARHPGQLFTRCLFPRNIFRVAAPDLQKFSATDYGEYTSKYIDRGYLGTAKKTQSHKKGAWHRS